MRIEKNEKTQPYMLNVKRFYAPFKVHTTCESCGVNFTHDFDYDYIGYPYLNKPFITYIYCPECEHEHEVKLAMSVDIKVVEEVKPID